MTQKSNVIIGVSAHKKNEHDSKTLEAALRHANRHRIKPIQEAICDRGYRGKKEVVGTKISIKIMFNTLLMKQKLNWVFR